MCHKRSTEYIRLRIRTLKLYSSHTENKKLFCILRSEKHYYSFSNEIRKQPKGGAIGNTLTERLGKLMGQRFSKKFRELLRKLKIETELSNNYVDDFLKVLASFDHGVRFDEEKMKPIKFEDQKSRGKKVNVNKLNMYA